VRFVEVSRCGRKLLTAGVLNATLWDVVLREPEQDFAGAQITGAAVSGERVVLASLSGEIAVWDRAGARRHSLLMRGGPVSCALLRGGARLVALAPGEASVWDVETGERLLELEGVAGAGGEVQHMAVSPCGRLVGVCVPRSEPRQVYLMSVWEASTGHRLSTMATEVSDRPAVASCAMAVGVAGSMRDAVMARGGP